MPALRALFTIPLAEQKIKFAEKLTEIVWSMPRLDELLGHTRALGARHVGYGVRATDYLVLGDALLAALAAVLGDSFDAATREAWALAYNLVRGVGVRVGEALIPDPAGLTVRSWCPASLLPRGRPAAVPVTRSRGRNASGLLRRRPWVDGPGPEPGHRIAGGSSLTEPEGWVTVGRASGRLVAISGPWSGVGRGAA